MSYITSTNKYSNNIKFQNKAKSTLRGCIYESSSKIKKNSNNNSKTKNIIYNTKKKYSDLKHQREIGYKEMTYIKNGIKNSQNKSQIREKFLIKDMNINSSRNKIKVKNRNISQPKTNINKSNENISKNDSSLKLGISDIMNIKKRYIKGIHINNFSKVLNISNLNSKNTFSKAHRNSFGLFNK